MKVKFETVAGRLIIRIEANSIDDIEHEINRLKMFAAERGGEANFIGPDKDGDKFTAIGNMDGC